MSFLCSIQLLVSCLVNKVTNFSQPQSSVQDGKAQAYRSYVEHFQHSNGGCGEEKCTLIYQAAHQLNAQLALAVRYARVSSPGAEDQGIVKGDQFEPLAGRLFLLSPVSTQ